MQTTMSGMMDGTWGMGIGGWLVALVVVLAIAALAKYLFFSNRGLGRRGPDHVVLFSEDNSDRL